MLAQSHIGTLLMTDEMLSEAQALFRAAIALLRSRRTKDGAL